MAFKHQTENYLKETEFNQWSLAGFLDYLAFNYSYSSSDVPQLQSILMEELRKKARSQDTPNRQKRKAYHLTKSLSKTWRTKIIADIIKGQDDKISQVSYKFLYYLVLNFIINSLDFIFIKEKISRQVEL